ncbi:uncharacterized protein LOC125665217 [Ostrea edulis]|uniref:uncharacterized protein LOC125665217 n=1 Tax=Ostrea edulis TaxID=37623 RepID=UPI0024AF009D|nr:uncharacterized protein LOC125665217 [Ostrea edulis]XP_048753809.2 uncharacterized protein LOC125665217 [Ostrea edulis]
MSNPEDVPLPRENEASKDGKREKELLAIRLQRAIREKKVSEAKNLLSEKPDIHYKDKVGSQCLHYATQEGLLDIVKLLLEEGAHVNCFDHNGRSPLHNAASRGHLDVVIYLVANGAQVASLDWDNHTPFEKAVISRCVDVVDVLLTFGAEPNLQDWTWVMDMKEKEKKILEIITSHNPLVPGYRYEGIKFAVVQVKSNEDCPLTMLNLTVKAIDVRNPFILFCRKMQSEFTELKSLLREEEIPYSDMFEIRTWGVTRKTLTLSLIVEGVPKCNEHLKIVSPLGHIGRVDNFVKNDDENTTEVLLTIKMNTKGSTQFAIASVFKKETFAISKEEVKIQPTSEPDAEIDIPKGTFETAGELQLNVMDTKDVNEDEEDESGPLLMTNVIDMSMSDGQQPKEEIVMKLPIHNKGDDEDGEVCMLATSEEDPEDPEDWEIIHAEKDSKGKAAVFKIKHFSIYAGANKKKVEEDKLAVIEAITRSIKKERKVEFRVFTRLAQERGKFQLILECWTPKKLRKSKPKWENEGCETVDGPQGIFVIDENQTFRLSFKGNCKKISSETNGNDDEAEVDAMNGDNNDDRDDSDNDSIVMDFVGKKGHTFTVVDMVVLNTDKPQGKVTIEKENYTTVQIEQKVADTGSFCTGKGKTIVVDKVKIEFEKLTEFLFGVKLPPPPKPLREPTDIQLQSLKEEKKLGEFIDKTESENPSFVPGMDMKNLANIARQLDDEEARIFGKNLGLPNGDIEKYMSMAFGAVWMLRQYRGKRPHFAQRYNIKRALEAIDRHDIVHLIIPQEDGQNITMTPKAVETNERFDIPDNAKDYDATEHEKYPSGTPVMDTSDVNSNVEDVIANDEE